MSHYAPHLAHEVHQHVEVLYFGCYQDVGHYLRSRAVAVGIRMALSEVAKKYQESMGPG